MSWSNDNKSELELPVDAQIKGLFVTAFKEPHLHSTQDVKVVSHQQLCAILGGVPVNPILAMSKTMYKVEFNRELTQPVQEMKTEKNSEPQLKDVSTLMKLIENKIIERFGSVDAYHLYRHIAELELAIKKEGISVKELVAEPLMRPKYLTIDYVFFTVHRIDFQSKTRFDRALGILEDMGFISTEKGTISLLKEVHSELWRLEDSKLVVAKDETAANIILYKTDEIRNEKISGVFAMFPPLIRIKLDEEFVIADIWT